MCDMHMYVCMSSLQMYEYLPLNALEQNKNCITLKNRKNLDKQATDEIMASITSIALKFKSS